MFTVKILDEQGEVVGVLAMNAKEFSTKSIGWHGQARLPLNGKDCMCQIQAVVIGSNPNSKTAKKNKAVKV